jgi:hypothetical protein
MTFGCQKDDESRPLEEESTKLRSGLVVQMQNRNHLIKVQPQIVDKIEELNKKSQKARGETSIENDFVINDEKVQIIEQENGSMTYTFSVERENPLDFELYNYVYQIYPDGSYKQYLFTYSFEVDSEGEIDFTNSDLDIEVFEDVGLILGRAGCTPEYTDAGVVETCGFASCTGKGKHMPGAEGDCGCYRADGDCEPYSWQCSNTIVFNYTDCSGGEPVDNNPPLGDTPSGGGTPRGASPTDDNTNQDTPIGEDYERQIKTCINGNSIFGIDDNDTTTINPNLLSTLNLNSGALYYLKKYLSTQNCSEEAQQEVIDSLIDAALGEIESCLGATLDSSLLDHDTIGGMYNYLIGEKECSDEAKVFTDLALEAWLEDGEVDFDEEIIKDKSFENNQRLNCVYNKFKETDNTISNYLENFLGERPVAHLKLTADTNFQTNFPDNPNAGAATSPPQDYIIEITFNTDPNSEGAAQNMPTIVLASDLIHEMLHAEIFRKLLSVAQQPEIPWSEDFIESHRNDFPTLMEYYCRWHYGNPTQPAATAQHQLIADYYRTMIKSALKDFDNNSHTESFYEMLSWSGLVGTVAWNNLGGLQNQYINQFNDIVENETHECSN